MTFFSSRLSLLRKVMLSTSVLLTAVFAATGLIVQRRVVATFSETLDAEVRASIAAYESLWRTRAERLRSISLILSTMSDVRAAFSTGDQATIRDTAGELWAKVSDENALFLVTDPAGKVIASLGGPPAAPIEERFEAVKQAAGRFPQQASGFVRREGRLYQTVVTPVFVASGSGQALLNVLVAGFEVDRAVLRDFQFSTGGSEFLFLAAGEVIASTLDRAASAEIAAQLRGHPGTHLRAGATDYAYRTRELIDLAGAPFGQLCILRSFAEPAERIAELQGLMLGLGLGALGLGLLLSYFLARRLIEPVRELDRAATEVGRQNYQVRLRPASGDELGRLARTFNAMCESIQVAREQLIRQERLSTIGRLSGSIVHDLRNPLAAVYGGAEMLVDLELSPAQVKRLAANIYRASRRIQELLQDLADVARGKSAGAEGCHLRDVAAAAVEVCAAAAEAQRVSIENRVDPALELTLERARVERVFVNLISNALEAMKGPGWIRIWSSEGTPGSATLYVEDNGPGLPAEVRERLFEPFVTAGKKNGLGLGLALSRQTIVDHGGDMWIEPAPGARFGIRLPLTVREYSTPARH